MTKFYGKIGFVKTEETVPGVWQSVFEERYYAGDVIRKFYRSENGSKVNPDLNISKSISIISDDYIYENLVHIAYVEWLGSLWKVTSVDPQRPRLILEIGGVYIKDEE